MNKAFRRFMRADPVPMAGVEPPSTLSGTHITYIM